MKIPARYDYEYYYTLGRYLVSEWEKISPDNAAVKKSLSAMLTP